MKNCAWSLVIHFDQLQVWSPNFDLQTGLETAGETVKLLQRQETHWEMDFCFVSLHLCVIMSLVRNKQIHLAQYCNSHFDRFSGHLARFATVIYVMFIRPAHLNILLGCSCRSVRNHFVEKLDHSFVASWSGQMCWQLSISI